MRQATYPSPTPLQRSLDSARPLPTLSMPEVRRWLQALEVLIRVDPVAGRAFQREIVATSVDEVVLPILRGHDLSPSEAQWRRIATRPVLLPVLN